MLRDALSAFQRWNCRGGRPSWTARASNRLSAIAFAAGLGPRHAATLRRYLELAPGARPFFPVDRRAPLGEFERIVNDYTVFRVV